MSRIDHIFASLRSRGRGGIMPFVVGGRPRADLLGAILRSLHAAGASIVEVGLPFSDPIADGPTIAQAMHKALLDGVTPRGIMTQVADARASLEADASRDDPGLGLVAMVSYSIVYRLGGPACFAHGASASGFDGLIVPDCPHDEAGELSHACADAGLTLSHLIAPTTPPERAATLARASTGFVYLLARAGVTGERGDAPAIADRVALVRSATDTPIACGFGIARPEHVRAVLEHADAAIIGSALVGRLEDGAADGAPSRAADFVACVSAGLPGAAGHAQDSKQNITQGIKDPAGA